MKRYYYWEDGSTVLIQTYKQVEEDCTFCKAICGFLEDCADNPDYNRLKGLATGNLRRHLKTQKHWRIIKEEVRKLRVECP
jgi:hypothetical protein